MKVQPRLTPRTRHGILARGFLLPVLVVLAGCAGNSPQVEPPPATPLPEPESEPAPEAAENNGQEALLDRGQQVVASVVDNTALWFDGLFATAEMDPQQASSSGRLTLGTRYDERDGLKTRVRFAARVPLPALKKRTRLVLGRYDTDDLLDGTESAEIENIGDQFNDGEDEDWFVGLGYRQRSGLASGFDAGLGVTFASGTIQPYVQANYRWNQTFGDDWLLRVRPRAFWRDDRGTGGSLTTILDYFVSQDWLLRSWNIMVTERNTEGVRWTTKLLAYQSLSGRSAFSYSVFATGETEGEVDVDDYGLEIRFRRSIYREWLFLELSTGVSWPREFAAELRERNLAIGADLEMRFGD